MSDVARDGATSRELPLEDLATAIGAAVRGGMRFAGLFAIPDPPGGTRLRAMLAEPGGLPSIDALVPPGHHSYPAITPSVPAAAWYEREIRDLYGLHPSDHPRPDPLVLPRPADYPPPRPGAGEALPPLTVDSSPLPAHLVGPGVFTIAYGPVRSGVFESVEYLVETPGEEIPHLRSRVYHKHRGIERRFEGMPPEDGVLMAERAEGVASVAHATAFCQAVEDIAGVSIPRQAALVRSLHGELERVANHLDSVLRHTEAAGQAVAYSRMSYHKERVMRLRADLCSHRFGRGVVLPGGVSGPPLLRPGELEGAIGELEGALRRDLDLLMSTPSFLDRLRGTGVIRVEKAASHGALGPVGRGSGQAEDVRRSRPYAAYAELPLRTHHRDEGDVLARQHVRVEEIFSALDLARHAAWTLEDAGEPPDGAWASPVDPEVSGESTGWAEAPQGEVLYLVRLHQGRLSRAKPRSASFHNFALFPDAFPKDILTDFAFIEASFGISIAGVAG